MELSTAVVGWNGQDMDGTELNQVPGPQQVVHVSQLFSHAGRSHDDGLGAPDPGDILFGEVVVVRVGEEDVVGYPLLRESPGVYVDLHAVFTDSDR
jgi:hypothetical protein